MNTPTIESIRRENLLLLIAEKETLSNVAYDCKLSYANLNHIKNQFVRTDGRMALMGSKIARQLEQGCGKPEGWMDVMHNDPDQEEWMNIYLTLSKDGRAALLEKARELTTRKRKTA